MPQPLADPEIGAGTYPRPDARFETMDEALAAYDEALARAGDREVGVFRHPRTGEYAVRVGDEHSVRSLGEGWESALHRHPNPDNVLTRRLPEAFTHARRTRQRTSAPP
jgi:hypothetical protein